MEKSELDFKKVVEGRRSVTYFDEKQELEEGLLREIINLAVLAPSSYNTQPWDLIAVKTKEKRQQLYDRACHQPKVLAAPVVLVVLGDRTGFKRYNPIWEEKKELGLVTEEDIENIIEGSKNNVYDTPHKRVGYAIRNSSLLAMSIMYSAKYYGVDTHPMIGFDSEEVKELYDIEENKEVTMLMAVGYFDQSRELRPRETRFQYEDIVREV